MLNTGAGTESYTWNAEERMATVTSSLYGDNTYTYDGHGQRVEKSSGMLYWYGAGGEVLAESDASGNLTDEYVFFNGHRLARIDASGNVDYYVADKLGSASVVTDANGNKLDDCDYLPYGETNCHTSSSGNHYLYTGLERDADQLDHTLHRQYSSSLGRWMSPDPGGVKVVHLNNPQTWNLYAYVADNPTTFVDPTGLAAAADGDGCSSAVQTNTTQTCGKVQKQSWWSRTLSYLGLGQKQKSEAPSSWTPDKPLPKDPTGLGPDWKRDPAHDPQGKSGDERYVNDKTGDKLDWHKGQPQQPGWKGKDHWHWVPGGRKQKPHYQPGDTVKKLVIVTGVGAIAHAIIETAPEWAPVLVAIP